jgi:hypothetical protein
LNFVLATSSVTSSSLANVSPWMASMRASKRWKSKGAGCGLYGGWEEQSIQVLWLLHVC